MRIPELTFFFYRHGISAFLRYKPSQGNISWVDLCQQLSHLTGGIYTGRDKLDTCAEKAEFKPK